MVDWLAERMLVEAAHALAQDHLVTATDGNLSMRCREAYLITPSGYEKRALEVKDLSHLTIDGKLVEGPAPSSEWAFHLAIYAKRPKINAVCHAHPDMVTALAGQNLAERPRLLFDAERRFPRIAYIPRLSPGSAELAAAVGKAASECDAILLADHGAITWGENPQVAVQQMTALERWARTICILENRCM